MRGHVSLVPTPPRDPQGLQPRTVVEHLSLVVKDYLKKRPHLSVNGISKRCQVSEPTLRRIVSNKVKTTPQLSTLLDLLTYVGQTTSVRDIVKMYPGPIADYLTDAMPYLEEVDQEYSNAVNDELKDPVKYLIYKLSLNHSGVSEEKINELYGNHGIALLSEMVEKGFIEKYASGICRARTKTYGGSHKEFVRNFKLVADFIKADRLRPRKPLNPYFINMSDSISPEAYEQIRRLQASLDKKIRKIVSSDEAKGQIPFFYIAGMDTLDSRPAYEWAEEED